MGVGGGKWQFSEDKRSAVIYLTSDTPYYDAVFYLDGEKGIMKYIMHTLSNGMTDRKVEYLLYRYDETDEMKLAVYNLKTNELDHTFKWNVKDITLGGYAGVTLYCYRSTDLEYDFSLELHMEGYMPVAAYYNAKKRVLKVKFDLSDKDYTSWPYEEEKRTPFEEGWDNSQREN